jgi:chromatin remodeling complex protein RSC6
MIDDSKEKVSDENKRILYKFDSHTLHDFYSVDMKAVNEILYENQLSTLLEKENQTLVRDLLQLLPPHTLDYFFLH